jgi:DNA polymerase-3 subunit epsilon
MDHGLLVRSNVSKKLDILVIADPESQSGKAQKAREYGTRLMSEDAFLRLLGRG